MIFDQRHMTGAAIHASVDDVTAEWERKARPVEDGGGGGFSRRVLGEVHHDLVRDQRKLDAYVSDSRWVADCPACGGGIACWAENPHGCCLDCGRVYRIVFPKERLDIERVLEPRPPENRNFLIGEKLAVLKVENLTHGVPLEQRTVEG